MSSQSSWWAWGCLWLTALTVTASGCSSWVRSDAGRSPWPWAKSEPKPKMPSRILAIWTDAVHHQSGQKAQRGFGGRIVFYEEAGNDPIQVDGQLTIYVFPDEPDREATVPERKFVFGAEELKRHYSKSSLGDSYSVWLPWDVVGGPTRQLTLIARLDAQAGGTVMSEPAKKMLPGVTRQGESAALVSPETNDPTGASGAPGAVGSAAPASRRETLTSSLTAGSASGQLRPVPADALHDPRRSAGATESAGGSSPPPTAPRSIADFLQQQQRRASEDPEATDQASEQNLVRPASYLEVDQAAGGPRSASQNRTSVNSHRVETIDLGQLRSNRAGAIAVPQHLLHAPAESLAMPHDPSDFGEATESTLGPTSIQRSDNALVSYGRPGERSGGLSRDLAAGGSQPAQADSESPSEAWPRVTRTLGSNRRSIAESRQQAIQSRPQHLRLP